MQNKVLELDIPALIQADASHQVLCDQCGKKIGERYPSGRNSMSLVLKKANATEDTYDSYVDAHFCNEDCLREHLVARKKGK